MSLKPIKPKRISDQVFEQLRELIYRGDFKPGEQIPPERDLAQSMEVSRTSVRNAINKLVTMGLLEHRQGQGTFVSSPESREGNPLVAAMGADEASIDDLLEVRLGLECNSAMLAAMRASQVDINAMRKALEEMEEDLRMTDKISPESDVAFHMAITFATRNPVVIHLMRSFYDFLFVGIKTNLVHLYLERPMLDEVMTQHRLIFKCIESRDGDGALEAMKEHILFVKHFFKKKQF
ncbi:MAG: FadR family transcriptional regulator [Desulforhopalus sp.]|nr:FadR family transcriptional regulator [Desulforhopalus sp.]